MTTPDSPGVPSHTRDIALDAVIGGHDSDAIAEFLRARFNFNL